jgi:hypothetical protein
VRREERGASGKEFVVLQSYAICETRTSSEAAPVWIAPTPRGPAGRLSKSCHRAEYGARGGCLVIYVRGDLVASARVRGCVTGPPLLVG